MTSTSARPDWLAALRRHPAAVAIGNLAWEFAQMPLYTLWRTGSPGEIAFAVLHCTAGDVVIAASSLVAAAAVAFGLAYTPYSEHLNLARGAWAYSEAMPTLPLLGTGLAPLAQWLVIPAVSLFRACRDRPRGPVAAHGNEGRVPG